MFKSLQYVFALLFVAVLALLPILLGEHFLVLLFVNIFIGWMLALGLQLLIGISGILSLGHAAFFGIGAYGSAILSAKYGISFPLALIAGGLLAGLGGLIMSPIIRLREVYFAMASFAFGILIYQVLTQWKAMTGGHDGLIMIPIAEIAGLKFDLPSKFYYLALTLFLLQYVSFLFLTRSSFGLALIAMRQSEAGARSVGLNITVLKIIVIVIAAATAGLAGGLYGHLYGSLSPHSFDWHRSIALLTMVVVGGSRGYTGVLVATAILMYLPEQLRAFSEYSTLINGIILTAVMVLLPNGLSGIGRDFGSLPLLRWILRQPKQASLLEKR